MKHKVAVSTNTYHGFSLEEALRGISAAGFKYVELTAVNGWTEHVKSTMSDAEIEEVKQLLKKYDLTPIALSGHCDLMDAKRLNDFVDNIRLAGKFGCEFIVSSTGEAHFGEKEVVADELLAENIKKVLPVCEELGITMVLETHGEYGLGSDLKRITDLVGSKRLGINYDTANVLFYGGKYPEDDIKDCAEDVLFVHVKDKAGEPKEWDFPAPGEGTLKLIETIEYLQSKGFTGPLSTEIEFTEDFTMRDKKEGDLEVVDAAVKVAYDFYKKHGFV